MTKQERFHRVISAAARSYAKLGRAASREEIAQEADLRWQTIAKVFYTEIPGIVLDKAPVGHAGRTVWAVTPSPDIVAAVEAGTYEVPAVVLPKGKPRRVGTGWIKGQLRHDPERIDLSTIGGRLRSCRVGAGMTQAAWAELLGSNTNVVGKHEVANTLPASRHLRVYAENGYSVDWIITSKGDRRIKT